MYEESQAIYTPLALLKCIKVFCMVYLNYDCKSYLIYNIN